MQLFTSTEDEGFKYPDDFYIKTAELRARVQEREQQGFWDLDKHEKWWRDRHHILEEHGCRMRPRFRPEWKPSWRDTDLNPMVVEDSIRLPVRPSISSLDSHSQAFNSTRKLWMRSARAMDA